MTGPQRGLEADPLTSPPANAGLGQGAPAEAKVVWVLLRGMARESGHWGIFPKVLLQRVREQQSSAEMILLDLPGNGAFYRESSPLQVSAMVDACRQELRKRGVQGQVHLLAMSLGAMVVSEWAQRFPKEVAAGVLINTSFRPFSPFYRRFRPLNYLAFFLLSLSRLSARQREQKILGMTTCLQKKPAEVLDHWVDLRLQRPVGLRNTARQLWAAMRYQASELRPAVPVLLLCSKADGLVDWRCSQAISRAWGAPLRLHARAGHDLALDDPLWVAQAVWEWLRVRHMHGLSAGQLH